MGHADTSRTPAGIDAGFPPGKPLLRDRPALRDCLAAVWLGPARLGARTGDLRFCAPTHRVRVPARTPNAFGDGGLPRTPRRVPRLRAPGHRVLPLHEHTGALLHRLSGRLRYRASLRDHGFRGLVRGLPWRPLVHLRRAQQYAASRPRADCARPRCLRCGAGQHFRPEHAGGFQSLDRRDLEQ
jgi:hypothetical protein